MKNIILASASPRRKVLLQCMGLDFDIIPSNFEEYLDDKRTPEEVAIELGLGKANDVAKDYPESYVIGSDLIIVVDGKQIAKPETEKEAYEMLRLLNNRIHDAIASVAVVNQAKHIVETDAAKVLITFDKIPEDVILAYIATGDPYDKAGGYARLHPLLAPYIHTSGDAHALVGMSTIQLRKILVKLGIPVPNDDKTTTALFDASDLRDQHILH